MSNTSSLSRETKESAGLNAKTLYLVETALMIAVTLINGKHLPGNYPHTIS